MFALVATSKTACLLSSTYICSTSGLNDTEFTFCGTLWWFIDSTGFVVPGKSPQSSNVIELYILLSFFNTFGLHHISVQVTVSFHLVVST